MINYALGKQNHKLTLFELQQLTGYLNFICRCIVPGRAFTRRLYAIGAGTKKQNHHVRLNLEVRRDLAMWKLFMEHPSVFSRPFVQFDKTWLAIEINMYTDASGSIGAGGFNERQWFTLKWDPAFLSKYKPSISYLELYAVTIAITKWVHRYANKKIALFCDNMGAVHMINSQSSNCRACMVLIRMIVVHGLIHNVQITAKYVSTKANTISDWLSRGKIAQFKKVFGHMFDPTPEKIPNCLWPMDKLMR